MNLILNWLVGFAGGAILLLVGDLLLRAYRGRRLAENEPGYISFEVALFKLLAYAAVYAIIGIIFWNIPWDAPTSVVLGRLTGEFVFTLIAALLLIGIPALFRLIARVTKKPDEPN